MSWRRMLLLALPLIIFLALAVVMGSRIGKDSTELPSALMDKPFPAFQLSGLQNADQRLDASLLQGQVSLVNVWATWCVSCQVEHPYLKAIAASGVPVIGVNYKDAREAASQYLVLHGNPFKAVIFDENGSLGLDLGVTGAPETFVVDSRGIIRAHYIGVLTDKEWRAQLQPLVQQLGIQKGQEPH